MHLPPPARTITQAKCPRTFDTWKLTAPMPNLVLYFSVYCVSIKPFNHPHTPRPDSFAFDKLLRQSLEGWTCANHHPRRKYNDELKLPTALSKGDHVQLHSFGLSLSRFAQCFAGVNARSRHLTRCVHSFCPSLHCFQLLSASTFSRMTIQLASSPTTSTSLL